MADWTSDLVALALAMSSSSSQPWLTISARATLHRDTNSSM